MDIDGNIDAQFLEIYIYIYKWHLDFRNNKIADVFFFFFFTNAIIVAKFIWLLFTWSRFQYKKLLSLLI